MAKKTTTAKKAAVKKAPAKKAAAQKTAPAKKPAAKIALDAPLEVVINNETVTLKLRTSIGSRATYQDDDKTVLLNVDKKLLK